MANREVVDLYRRNINPGKMFFDQYGKIPLTDELRLHCANFSESWNCKHDNKLFFIDDSFYSIDILTEENIKEIGDYLSRSVPHVFKREQNFNYIPQNEVININSKSAVPSNDENGVRKLIIMNFYLRNLVNSTSNHFINKGELNKELSKFYNMLKEPIESVASFNLNNASRESMRSSQFIDSLLNGKNLLLVVDNRNDPEAVLKSLKCLVHVYVNRISENVLLGNLNQAKIDVDDFKSSFKELFIALNIKEEKMKKVIFGLQDHQKVVTYNSNR